MPGMSTSPSIKGKSFNYNTKLPDLKKSSILNLNKPILVSCESFVPFNTGNTKCMSDDGMLWYLDLMYFDELSRNSNFYPADDTKRSFRDSNWVQENLKNRTWYGELEHPPAESCMERFLRVEPTRYAINILSLEDKNDHFSGMIGMAAPLGTSICLPNIKMYGSNYGVSARISTPNFIEKMYRGRKIYIKKYKQYPITFDFVTTSGLPKCKCVKTDMFHGEQFSLNKGIPNVKEALSTATPITIQDEYGLSEDAFKKLCEQQGKVVLDKDEAESYGISTESANPVNNNPMYVVKFDNAAKEFARSIMRSEENANIISDIYGIDFDKTTAIFTDDNRVKLTSTEGASVSIALNSYLLSNALNM